MLTALCKILSCVYLRWQFGYEMVFELKFLHCFYDPILSREKAINANGLLRNAKLDYLFDLFTFLRCKVNAQKEETLNNCIAF